MIKKIQNFIKRAYFNGHFPSFWKLYFSKKNVFAYYGFLGDKNFGDELVFHGTKSLFKDQILLPILHHCPLYVKLYKKFFYRRIKGIVIGGGTLIGPFFSEKHLFNILLKGNIPVFFHGTGVTPTTSFNPLWTKMLAMSNFGGLRGNLSVQRVFEGSKVKKNVVGDACFALYDALNKTHIQSKSILINYGAHNKYEGQEECKHELIRFANEMKKCGYQIDFLPMHQIDLEEARNFSKEISELKVLPIPRRYDDLKDLLGDYHFLVGVRLHFIALAILSHVPFYSINYKDKHNDLLQSLDLSFAGKKSTETTFEEILQVFEHREKFNWKSIEQDLRDLREKQMAEYATMCKFIG